MDASRFLRLTTYRPLRASRARRATRRIRLHRPALPRPAGFGGRVARPVRPRAKKSYVSPYKYWAQPPTLGVYVAAPYAHAEFVKRLHRNLVDRGLGWTSSWAENANGPDALTEKIAAEALQANDFDLENADIVLALAFPTAGGEMFCEMARAILLGKPVVYVPYEADGLPARRVLSAYRPEVTICHELDEAIDLVVQIAIDRGQHRGETRDGRGDE